MKDQSGYIKLHRQIRKHWIWEHPDYFRAWCDILMLANHTTQKRMYDDKVFMIKRGQFPTSLRSLAARWGWSKNKVVRFLNALKADTMVDTATDTGWTLLTVCNYETYQISKKQTDTDTNPPADTVAGHRRDNYNNYKNYNKTIPPYSPPAETGPDPRPDIDPGDTSFSLEFWKLWVDSNSPKGMTGFPTPYESQQIINHAKKYNDDITFWLPLLEERQKRMKAGEWIHTSIKAFAGGGFREYDPKAASPKKKKLQLDDFKTKAGTHRGFCSKCGKDHYFSHPSEIYASSCCGVPFNTTRPKQTPPDEGRAGKPPGKHSNRSKQTESLGSQIGQYL